MTPTLSDYPICKLIEDSNVSATSLHELIGDNNFVIDFWTTKCTRCPAALDKLSVEAEEAKHRGQCVVYVSCVLDNKDIAGEIVEESEGWGALVHVFMELEAKERLKKDFDFSEVPFCIVGDKEKRILGAGNPKKLNVPQLVEQAVAKSNAESGVLNSSLFTDEDF